MEGIFTKNSGFDRDRGKQNHVTSKFFTFRKLRVTYAGNVQTRPRTVEIEGEVEKPRSFDIDDLLRLASMEEWVYRLRCIEAWPMVIPWNGYPLSTLLGQVRPTSKAKYV